jgi:hypothetical protein
MIYDKNDKKTYIIRGLSATLFWSKLCINDKPQGYIVNTELESLREILTTLEVLSFTTHPRDELVFSEPKPLKTETIYEANPLEIVEVGEIKENKKEYAYGRDWRTGYSRVTDWTSSSSITMYSSYEELFKVFGNIWESLDIDEFDELFRFVFGKSFLEASYEEIEGFVDIYFPRLNSHITETKIRAWRKLTGVKPCWKTYEKFEIQFPYFVNKVSELNNTLKRTENEN